MEVMAIIGALAMLVGIVIIAPFINFAEGWIVGHLIKWIFGATFVSGLAMLGIHISPGIHTCLLWRLGCHRQFL